MSLCVESAGSLVRISSVDVLPSFVFLLTSREGNKWMILVLLQDPILTPPCNAEQDMHGGMI